MNDMPNGWFRLRFLPASYHLGERWGDDPNSLSHSRLGTQSIRSNSARGTIELSSPKTLKQYTYIYICIWLVPVSLLWGGPLYVHDFPGGSNAALELPYQRHITWDGEPCNWGALRIQQQENEAWDPHKRRDSDSIWLVFHQGGGRRIDGSVHGKAPKASDEERKNIYIWLCWL